MWKDITEKDKNAFNQLATHPLQTYEWGEFRKRTGITVIRRALQQDNKLTQTFQLTIHKIPHTPWSIGYLPKGSRPTAQLLEELKKIGKQKNCIFIQLEPNVIENDAEQWKLTAKNLNLRPAAHPLFTKHTLQIDLTKSEEELLKNMHPKARYNIKIAQKHGVIIKEENTQKAFNTFWELTQQTTSRQQFFAHTKNYHLTQWQTLPHIARPQTLSSHLLLATYQGTVLTSWIVFVFKDMLYYPYGASSSQHRETMHSTLMMWEAIRFGKKHHLKTFDLWGAAAPDAPSTDPWHGFTQFKERFGPERIEFVGSFDVVLNPLVYQGFKVADKLRWLVLKLKN